MSCPSHKNDEERFFFKKHYNLKHLLSPKGEQNIFSFSVFEENPILLR